MELGLEEKNAWSGCKNRAQTLQKVGFNVFSFFFWLITKDSFVIHMNF